MYVFVSQLHDQRNQGVTFFLIFRHEIVSFQLKIRAIDQGFPQLSSIATVEVVITRVTEVLSFILPSYTRIISENTAVAINQVTQVSAQPGVRHQHHHIPSNRKINKKDSIYILMILKLYTKVYDYT